MNKVTQDLYHTTVSVANKIVSYTASSDFNTLGIDMSEFDAPWTLQITRSASDGTPTVTAECSDDNSNWVDYKAESVNVSIPELFIDDEFKPRYLRVKYTANSATGTVTMKLTTQQNTQ